MFQPFLSCRFEWPVATQKTSSLRQGAISPPILWEPKRAGKPSLAKSSAKIEPQDVAILAQFRRSPPAIQSKLKEQAE
jgi:hypothetical protein